MIIQNDEEKEVLREGGRRLARILGALKEKVLPGISTLDLETLTRDLINEGGDKAAFLGYSPRGAKRPFPAALCVSVNEEIVHGIPNEDPRILQEGDIVTLDLGLAHKGLITDSAITVGVGKISTSSKQLMNATRECLNAGIRACRAGGTTGDIGHAIEEESKKYPFGLVRDLGGHGVGRKVHDEPYVPNFGTQGEGDMLEFGQVIAIEPQLTLGRGEIELAKDGYTYETRDGSVSAHFEHTVLVTEGGCEVLTS